MYNSIINKQKLVLLRPKVVNPLLHQLLHKTGQDLDDSAIEAGSNNGKGLCHANKCLDQNALCMFAGNSLHKCTVPNTIATCCEASRLRTNLSIQHESLATVELSLQHEMFPECIVFHKGQTCQPFPLLSAEAMLLVLKEGSSSSRWYWKPSSLQPSCSPGLDLFLPSTAGLKRSMPMMVREWPSCWKYSGGLPAGSICCNERCTAPVITLTQKPPLLLLQAIWSCLMKPVPRCMQMLALLM